MACTHGPKLSDSPVFNKSINVSALWFLSLSVCKLLLFNNLQTNKPVCMANINSSALPQQKTNVAFRGRIYILNLYQLPCQSRSDKR